MADLSSQLPVLDVFQKSRQACCLHTEELKIWRSPGEGFWKKAMRSIKIKRNINLLRQYPFCHFLCTVGQLLVVQTHDSCIKSTECKWTEGAQIYSTTKYRRTPTNSSTETFLTFSLQSAGTGCSSAGLLRCVTWRLMKACKSLPRPQ